MIDHRLGGGRQDVGMVLGKTRFGGFFVVRRKSQAITPPCRLRLLETLLQQVPRDACVHIICDQWAQFVGCELFAISL